ncbi:hypothetical protein RHOSPDRAFT_26003 [Rhodotorula sp. JG-1b]|nr:hypothetical protein RHOSPDRAFT_26003 [Rhodotorula sp. JG-1b]
MYDAYAPSSSGAVSISADYQMPADSTSTGGALSSSPSRRHSIASTASPTRYAPSLSGRDGFSTDGVRSYGAALGSVPDRTVPFPRQPAGATAAYADEPTRALYDFSQAPGVYDEGQYRYGKTPQPRGGPGATALLQQHVANQWAFRANQQPTLPTPPSHLAQSQVSSEPQNGRRGSLQQPAPASYSSLSQSQPQPSTYVPYGFTRPSPRDKSSSDSSTAASTPVTVSMSSNTTPSTSSGSNGGGANSRTRASSANDATSSTDFGQSFYDPFRIKHRRRTSPAQLRILEHHFSRSPKPDLALRKQLATELDMTPREVQVWVSFRSFRETGRRTPGGLSVDERIHGLQFQNRRAKVKKLQERAARSTSSSAPSSSQVAPEQADEYEADEAQIRAYETHSRNRPVSAAHSGQPGNRNGSASLGGDTYAHASSHRKLQDPLTAVPYPTPTVLDAHGYPLPKSESTGLPLPPRPPTADYFDHHAPIAGRRYSLPAFNSSVIPPTPSEEYPSGPAGGPMSSNQSSLALPSGSAPVYRRRPSLGVLAPTGGVVGAQSAEYSPSGSASSRGSDIKPLSIPEHAEVSSWDSDIKPTSTEQSPVVYQHGGSLSSRRSSAPPQALSHLQAGEGYGNYLISSPTTRPLSTPAWTAPSETSYAVNPAVYPPPTSLIDPVGSVSYVQETGPEMLYDYRYAYPETSVGLPVSAAHAPLDPSFVVTAGDLDRSLV